MTLKPQDIVILLKLAALQGKPYTVRSLASQVFISPSEVSESFKRLSMSRLLAPIDRRLRWHPVEELLVHGVKYVFPPDRGGLTRGMPTAYAAPPLCQTISESVNPPVWPCAVGKVRGYAFSPLYPTVPQAATLDVEFYELLTLVDTLRDGSVRESALAVAELTRRLEMLAA